MEQELGTLPRKLVVFTGAGMSAESGVDTFRTHGGIWQQVAVEDVATPEAWERDPDRVTAFYNRRRRQLVEEVAPHAGHRLIAALEQHADVRVVTQNVDDLHERAGSSQVLHLHGELRRVRSSGPDPTSYPWERWEVRATDCCPAGHRLRPDVVWFGEEVPNWPLALHALEGADALLVVGTSLRVYPVAGIVEALPDAAQLVLVDPEPIPLRRGVQLHLTASAGLRALWSAWLPGVPVPPSDPG